MKLLSLARDLKRRKARERHGLFVAEGVRTVEELLDSDLPVRGALMTEAAGRDPRVARIGKRLSARSIPCEIVGERDFDSAADTDTPQGVLALAEIPRRAPESLTPRGLVLVLDAVQDPGNVGTILRTAAALGASVIVALPGTVDLWNAKVVRSAMGALFTHPVLPLPWDEAAAWLHGVPLWIAAADGEPLAAAAARRPSDVALVVANEGAGVSSHVAAAAARRVAIPMAAGAESLNVAVATGILLYVLGTGTP